MRISVVIPVYNGEPFIRDCLASALSQTHPAHEIIVVNDGSTDTTGRLLREYAPRIRVIDQPNRGRSAARNEGIRASSGDYVAFLDADDAFRSDHLAHLAQTAETSKAEIVYGAVRHPYLTDGEHQRLLRRRSRERLFDHLFRFQLPIQASMVKRDSLREKDVRFREGVEIAEDALFYWSLILLGARAAFTGSTGTVLGIHEGNTTKDLSLTYARTLEAYALLESFIAGRSLEIPPLARRRIEQGKQHARILTSLVRLYDKPCTERRRALFPFLTQPHVAPVDRTRCLLAQVWPHVPLARHPAVLRGLFGYSILRRAGVPAEASMKPSHSSPDVT